jgi:dUTP pyrophosphatase
MKVQVINKSGNELPKYETPQSAGMDLRADLWSINEKFLYDARVVRREDGTIDHIVIETGGRALIPTELYTAIPKGYEVQIRPRSGLALKHGVTVLNTPGTIDADYRNGWGVILMNNDLRNSFKVYQGDRIAQAVLAKVEQIEWEEVEELDSTERGLGGFGHTGSN